MKLVKSICMKTVCVNTILSLLLFFFIFACTSKTYIISQKKQTFYQKIDRIYVYSYVNNVNSDFGRYFEESIKSALMSTGIEFDAQTIGTEGDISLESKLDRGKVSEFNPNYFLIIRVDFIIMR